MNALLDLLDTNPEAERLYEAFRRVGYLVTAEPIPGSEDTFVSALREGFERVGDTLASNARRYGFRGLSKAALAALHQDLPRPCWLVERRREL